MANKMMRIMEQVSMISMTRYDRNIRFMDTPPALGVSVAQSSISKSPRNSNAVFTESRQRLMFSKVAHHGLSSEQLCPLWLAPVQVARLKKKSGCWCLAESLMYTSDIRQEAALCTMSLSFVSFATFVCSGLKKRISARGLILCSNC